MCKGRGKSSLASMWWPRRSNRWLLFFLFVAIFVQVWVVQHAAKVHEQYGGVFLQEHGNSKIHSSKIGESMMMTGAMNTGKAPRILIGILGNAHSKFAMTYRERHRKLFQLWNDTRLCPFADDGTTNNEYRKTGTPFQIHDDCQIIYSFILGAHPPINKSNMTNETFLPFHLGDSDGNNDNNNNGRPLTLSSHEAPIPFGDMHSNDVTILNIRENMNEGKTPTFVHWAVQTAKRHKIDYIMKCDSDAYLRWNGLLRFLHKELPPSPPPPTVLGMFRHTAFWNSSAFNSAEPLSEQNGIMKQAWSRSASIWEQEWYAGMHLYLAGQLYVLSVAVGERLVEEARYWYRPISSTNTNAIQTNYSFCGPYFAGHEDHDALSMIQQPKRIPLSGSTGAFDENPLNARTATVMDSIRWISIAKHYSFWEHPVKGVFRWERIWRREQKQAIERLEGKKVFPQFNHHDRKSIRNSLWTPKPSIMVILLKSPEDVIQHRQKYLSRWKKLRDTSTKMDNICPISSYFTSVQQCDIYYVFVVGNKGGSKYKQLVHHQHNETSLLHDDLWRLPVRHDVNKGIATTTLSFIHEKIPEYSTRLDYVLLIQSDFILNFSLWKEVVGAQVPQAHSVMIGEVRDKYQKPREFLLHKREAFWHEEYDNVHLYLGSDALAFSSALISGMVDQAKNRSQSQKYWEDNLGHDLSLLAYFVPKTTLQWIPILKSMRFWEPINF